MSHTPNSKRPKRKPVKGAVHNGNCIRTTITLPKSWESGITALKRRKDRNMSQLAREAVVVMCADAGIHLPAA